MEPQPKIMRLGKAFLLAALVISASVVRAQTAAEQIGAESARLRQLLPTLKLSDDQVSAYTTSINLIDSAVGSRNLYQAMNYLQRTRVELMTHEYLKAHADIEKQGLTAFESEWSRVGKELAAREKSLAAKRNPQLPAAVRALVEASLTQVQPYYQSGRLYGQNTTINAGLYYIGLAPANLDFAVFCQQLKFDLPKTSPKLKSISVQIEALEQTAIKAFQDPNNASKQRSFILINSALKMARELDAEKRYAGSLKCYLDALMEYGLVDAATPDAQGAVAIKSQAEAMRSKLTAANSDETIGLTFLEMALAAQSEAALKRAAVIVDKVLPGYMKVQSETRNE